MSLAADIGALIDKQGDVSFAQLSREWPEHFHDGDVALLWPPPAENIVIWTGLSEAGEAAVRELMDGVYALQPTPFMVYVVDGQTLTLPVASSARKYKRMRWLPVVIVRAAKA